MPTARSRVGDRGEGIARAYLKSKGYELVTTNFHCRWGEVDIIARDGQYLVFVEVRTRRRPGWYGEPEESISNRKGNGSLPRPKRTSRLALLPRKIGVLTLLP